MRRKTTLEKMLTGLIAAATAALLLPVVALAAPVTPPVQESQAPGAHNPGFTALEIFPQETQVLTPRWNVSSVTIEYIVTGGGQVSNYDAIEIFPQEAQVTTPRTTGAVTNDNTQVDAAAIPGSTVLFVVGGVATSVNAATGEWQIGNPPMVVYDSDQTVLDGAPAQGDPVRVVGKRTLSFGPIVAQYISRVITPPEIAAPAVTTALLLNGSVTAMSANSWTVSPQSGAASATFNILADAGASGAGPTVIEPGITQGTIADLTVFNPAPPDGATVLYVIGGVATAVNSATGEWQVGNPPVFVYESAQTQFIGAPVAGDAVRVVGKRGISPGPVIAQYVARVGPPEPAAPAVMGAAFLLNGTVTAADGATWTVAPSSGRRRWCSAFSTTWTLQAWGQRRSRPAWGQAPP